MNFFIQAQDIPLSLTVKSTEHKIVVDGKIDEQAWETAEIASDFHQHRPSDNTRAEAKTEVRVTYDDQTIYFLVVCYDDLEGDYITPSLRRDYRGGAYDGVSIVLDPFQDKTNAYLFGVNPFGVQREALISNGGQGRQDYSLSWDNKWYAEARIYDGYWVAEIAIPLKTIRFKEGSSQWNANFYRIDSKLNERSTWNRIPRNQQVFNVGYTGHLNFDKPLPKPGMNMSLIPYFTTGTGKDYEDGITDNFLGVGGDAKISLGSSLNLDLTVNPDFSQVEVDRQVNNLSRFEISFPERRQFFLENADIFSDFGERSTRPFFSRRIGIAEDTATSDNIQNKIFYGARLSGKLNQNWRIGLMNMQTQKEDKAGLTSLNYSVAALQRKVFARSNIAAIFVNKQNLGHNWNPDANFINSNLGPGENLDDLDTTFNYNRVAGLDFNLFSANSEWSGKFFYHQSFDGADTTSGSFIQGARLKYNLRRLILEWTHVVVGDGYNAEVGFVPRSGFFKIEPKAEFYFYPKSGVLNRHGPESEAEFIWDQERKTDHKISLKYQFNFQSQAFLNFSINQDYTYLFDDFDPSRNDGLELAEGTDYTYHSVQFFFRDDQRRSVYANGRGNIGQYFNGTKASISGDVNWRMGTMGILAANFSYDNINLPEGYSDAEYILFGPRLDVSFSRKLFLTTLVQYSNRSDNMNINSRVQWRFAPASDMFLVYTDNYMPSDWTTKNRSLVFKISYWLNI